MQARTLLALGAAALSVLACSNAGLPSPSPTSVEPARGFVGRPTSVVIHGKGFQVRAAQPAGGGAPEVDAAYSAWLGNTALTNVVRVDDETLRATVPSGLPLGPQALRVDSPFGRSGQLSNAFVVEGTAAGGLRATIQATPATVSVGQTVTVTVGVENTGTAAVSGVVPDPPAVTGTGQVAPNPFGPSPASIATLEPGATGTFTWTYVSSGAGGLSFAATVNGTDTFSGNPIAASTDPLAPANVTVQRPATLSVILSLDGRVALGGNFTVRMTVSNSGDAAALGVRPSSLTLATGSVRADLVNGPDPAVADVPGATGTTPGTVTFSWTYAAGGTDGTVQFSGGASGTDANSSTATTAPSVLSNIATVGQAVLTGVLTVPATGTVSNGQTFAISLAVTNQGTAAVTNLVPAAPRIDVPPSGGGAVTLVTGPTPASVASLGPGQTETFQWTYRATTVGQISFTASAAGTDSFSGAQVRASGTAPVLVQTPARLEVSTFTASRTSGSTNQPIAMTLTLRNTGAATASVTSVAPTVAPVAGTTCTVPTPAATPALPVSILGGNATSFTWTCTSTTTGTRTLGATVAATDSNSDASVAPTVTGIQVAIQGAASLTATAFSASRTSIAVGQLVTITLTLTNAAGAASANVTAVVPSAAPASGMACPTTGTTVSPSLPQTVAGGTSVTFTWTCTGTSPGAYNLNAGITASDVNSGTNITPPTLANIPVTVQASSDLVATTFATNRPTGTAAPGQAITVTLTLSNAAGNGAANVTVLTPTATIVTGTGTVTCGPVTSSVSPAVPQTINGGASATFTWPCTPSGTTAGIFQLSASITATDVNNGSSVAPTLTPLSITVQRRPVVTATAFTVERAGVPAAASITAARTQPVTVRLTLQNAAGGATANVSAVAPSVTPATGMTCGPAVTPVPPQAIAAGASVTLSWTCNTTAASPAQTYAIGAAVTAADANDNSSLGLAPFTGPTVVLQLPPVLTAAPLAANRTTMIVGQDVTLTLDVTNGAGLATANVTAVAVTSTPAAGMTCPSPATTVTPLPPQPVAGGATLRFTWTCRATATSATPYLLGATVTASDANTGAAVTVPPPTGVSVTVQTGAALVSTLSATLSVTGFASVNQVIPYTYRVQNIGTGSAQINTVSVRVTAGTGTCGAVLPAVPQTLAGGATRDFTFTCTPTAAGTFTVLATASGVDVNTSAPITDAFPFSVIVQTAAVVTAPTLTAPATASANSPFTVTLQVAKTGEAAATVSNVVLNNAGVPAAFCTGLTPAPPVNNLPAAQAFTWTCTPTTPSPPALTLSAVVTWNDANVPATNLTATSPTATVTVQAGATIAAATPTVTGGLVTPTTVDASQPFTLRLAVTKGGVAAANVTGFTLNAAAAAVCNPASQSPATPINGFVGPQTFTWTCAAAATPAALNVTVNWVDANAPLVPRTSTPATGVAVTVESHPSLSVTAFTVGTPVLPGADFVVTMTVTNAGQAAAAGVAPGVLTPDPGNTGTAVYVSGPTGSPASVAGGGGTATFTWTYNNTTAIPPGSFALQGGASGSSENSGLPYTAPPVTSTAATLNLMAGVPAASGTDPAPEVVAVSEDPLGDGTATPLLAGWQGEAWVGPSRDGRSFARLGTGSARVPVLGGVAVGLDLGATPMTNAAWTASGMATTLGAPGCAPGSSGCGPDGEQGVAALATGGIFGADLLAVAGLGAGARYVYAGYVPEAPVGLAWVDLASPLEVAGGDRSTVGFTALLAAPGAPDRLYVGLSSQGGPRLLALETPPGNGLDALQGTDAVDLAVGALPGVSGGQGVTALADVAGVLYVGHVAGVVRADVSSPEPATLRPEDWAPATPSAAAWSAKVAVPLPAAGRALPSDRAVAWLASFGTCASGPCVFMARNVRGTATQPATVGQLWRCEPSAGPGRCGPDDWALALGNSAGDPLLTQAGAETNGAIAVLAATRAWLYVGFDNATTGVQVFRSAGVPRSLADLKGRGGCAAGSAGCEGLGGNGLGRARNARILDARVIDAGAGPELWLVAGDGVGAASVHRIAD